MGIRFPPNHVEMEPFSMCRIAIDLINSAYYCISSGWTSVGEATTMLKTVKFVGIRGNLSIIIIPQGACPRGVFVDPLKRFVCRDTGIRGAGYQGPPAARLNRSAATAAGDRGFALSMETE